LQTLLYELLAQWGDAGFEAHLKGLQSEYGAKCRTIIAGFEKHMKGLGEWTAPKCALIPKL
jgi:DNA-binding transcriptional MocR family regulator